MRLRAKSNRVPSAGLEPATPALGRRRSGPLSYEGNEPEYTTGYYVCLLIGA
jgi:hypothetical protein